MRAVAALPRSSRPSPGTLVEPRVGKALSRAEAKLWLDDEHVRDQVFRLYRDMRPLGVRELDIPLADQLELSRDRLVVEWRIPAEHNVEDDTDRPDIALIAISFTLQHLRCNVLGCTAAREHLLRLVLEEARETKICDFDLAVLHVFGIPGQQNVSRVQVAMHDSLRVQVVHCLRDLPHQHCRVSFGVEALVYNLLQHLAARDVLARARGRLRCSRRRPGTRETHRPAISDAPPLQCRVSRVYQRSRAARRCWDAGHGAAHRTPTRGSYRGASGRRVAFRSP